MLFIAEAALHLFGYVLMYSVGRFTIIALSFGSIQPRCLKEFWLSSAEKDRAMEIYFEIVAITILGMGVLGTIVVLGLFLYR